MMKSPASAFPERAHRDYMQIMVKTGSSAFISANDFTLFDYIPTNSFICFQPLLYSVFSHPV